MPQLMHDGLMKYKCHSASNAKGILILLCFIEPNWISLLHGLLVELDETIVITLG